MPRVFYASFYTRCTSVIISCAQPDSYWFMTRRRQSWTSHSWFMSRDFSLSSRRVETTFVNRVSHRESRYLDLLIPSRQVMSFRCRAKDLSRARELSKGHTSSREMIGEKKLLKRITRITAGNALHRNVQTNVDQDRSTWILNMRINTWMIIHAHEYVRINRNKE